MPKFEVTVTKQVILVVEAPTKDAALDFVNDYTDDIGNEEWGNNYGFDWQEDGFSEIPEDDKSEPDVVVDDLGVPQ